MSLPNQKTLTTAIVLALSGALFGCGDKNDTSTQTATPTGNTMTSHASPVGELAAVQEITINNGAEPESLDPHKVSGVPESNLLRQMMVGLTTTDKDGKTIGGMATEWSSDDNKVWTFKLRDANWSNGDPVTAQDFEYSFKRLVDPATGSPYASYLEDVKMVGATAILAGKADINTLGVKALDDKTLQITLEEPVPYLPDTMVHTAVLPVSQKAVESLGDKWSTVGNYVANGAYNLTNWQINERITLERNPSYFDDANTTINKITFLAIPSDVTDVQRYKAGEVDMTASSLPAEQFDQLKQELPNELHVGPSLCTYHYEFNQTKAPFNDARVRRALALTVDREIVVNNILKQGQKPAYRFSPLTINGIGNYEAEWKSWDTNKRIEEAKKLLNEAGYNESNPLKFDFLYNTSEAHKKLALAAVSFWQDRLGFVEVNLDNQEWKTYLETKRNQKFEMARAGWCADYNEASTFLNTFKSNNSNNYGKYSNPEFDRIMNETLSGNTTPEARAALYEQAEKVLDQDTAAIYLYYYVTQRLVKPYVAGYSNADPQSRWQVKDMKIIQH